jgi:UDP-GlcNAc:undecaprenyl-phosphate GlcNAc-1-phosphate transferase
LVAEYPIDAQGVNANVATGYRVQPSPRRLQSRLIVAPATATMPAMPAMVWPVLALIVVGSAISLPLTALLLRLGHRKSLLDSAGASGHAKQLRRIPNIGGIAIYASVMLPMLLGLAAIWLIPGTLRSFAPALSDDLLARIRESTPTALAMLACMTLLHVMGLVDDRRSLRPIPKFAIQFACAFVLAMFFDVRLLTLLDHTLPAAPWPSVIVTVLWIVAIINAINFMDNMDGLAGGVSAIAAALFMIATILNAQWFIAGTLALLIGGLIGFLIFNFPAPNARIFMGDGGSLVVGFLLAVLTARTTFYNPDDPGYALGGGWYGVFMPVIVLAIPLYDFITVTTIRLAQGKSPFVGDQQHFSHRLVQRGLSKRGAVLVIWGATAVTGIGGISLGSLQAWQAILVGAQTVLMLMIIWALEHASRHAVGRGHAS